MQLNDDCNYKPTILWNCRVLFVAYQSSSFYKGKQHSCFSHAFTHGQFLSLMLFLIICIYLHCVALVTRQIAHFTLYVCSSVLTKRRKKNEMHSPRNDFVKFLSYIDTVNLEFCYFFICRDAIPSMSMHVIMHASFVYIHIRKLPWYMNPLLPIRWPNQK